MNLKSFEKKSAFHTTPKKECNGTRPAESRQCFPKEVFRNFAVGYFWLFYKVKWRLFETSRNLEQKCRDQWNVSAWNQCSSGCGAPSVRRRHVTCKSSSCEGSKPKNLESCTRKCSYSWKKSPWVRVLAKLTLSCNFMRKTLNKVDLLWSMWGSLNTADYMCRKQSKCKFDLETGLRLSLDTFKSLKNHWRNLGAG